LGINLFYVQIHIQFNNIPFISKNDHNIYQLTYISIIKITIISQMIMMIDFLQAELLNTFIIIRKKLCTLEIN